MGSLIAVQLAHDRPDLVRAAVVMGTCVRKTGFIREWEEAEIALRRDGGELPPAFATAHYAMQYYPAEALGDDEVWERIKPFVEGDFAARDGAMLAAQWQACLDFDSTDLLPRTSGARPRRRVLGGRADAAAARARGRASWRADGHFHLLHGARARLGVRPPARRRQRLPAGDPGRRAAVIALFIDRGFPMEPFAEALPARSTAAPRSAPDEAGDVVAIVTGTPPVGPAEVAPYPNLRLVLTCTIGTDHLDVAGLRDRGLVVANTPTYCTQEVAEHALACALAGLRGLPRLDAAVRAGTWDYAAAGVPLRFADATLGIVGLGRIGRALATLAAAVGMTVVAHDPYAYRRRGAPARARRPARAQRRRLAPRPRRRAACCSGLAQLARMKPTATLLNLARPDLVDLDAMVAALRAGDLGGAFWDVWPEEPADPGDPRLQAPGLRRHAARGVALGPRGPGLPRRGGRRPARRAAQRVLSASSTASIAAGSPTVMRSRSGRSWSSSDRTRIPWVARCAATAGASPTTAQTKFVSDGRWSMPSASSPASRRARLRAVALAAAGDLGLVVDARERGGDRRVGDVVVVPGRDEPRGDPRGPGEPADPQAGEPVHLRERPQRADVRARADVLGDGVGMVRPGGELPVRLVDDDEHVLGHRVEEGRRAPRGRPMRRSGCSACRPRRAGSSA